MPQIIPDFSLPEQAAKYPRHGWAVNSQDVRLLWLPMANMLAFWNPHLIRQAKGIESSSSHLVPSQPFRQTLLKLVVALRELHQLCRETSLVETLSPANVTAEQRHVLHHGAEMAPLFVDLSFVYLRVLADRFVDATRPLLFQHFTSAPREYKKMREFLRDKSRVAGADPIVDVNLLAQAFDSHSSWFDVLRQPGGGGKGIRDAMEHRPVITNVGHRQVEGERPELVIHLHGFANDVTFKQELTSTLRECLRDMCQLWTDVSLLINSRPTYDRRDWFPVVGLDDDIVGFWPEV